MNGELSLVIEDAKGDLEKIREWIRKNPFDDKVTYLNSFAVIKSSGAIESVFKMMIFEKLSNGTNEEVEKYLSKMILESSFNPKTGKIESLLSELNNKWKLDFVDYLRNNTQEKSDLNSLVQQRNTFSHGGRINVSIEVILKYFNSGVSILEELYRIINK